jgi:predicted TPR repeat methyltransferase
MTLAPVLRSTGDLIADRRYAWAQGAMDEGDPAAAAELAEQALELAPGFAPLHALLGRAQLALGDRKGAKRALERALTIEPDDPLGARLDLARLGALDPDEAMTPGYVRALFDSYADGFEAHLTGALAYRGPEILRDAILRACAETNLPTRFRRALDLGCGTGLMARALHGLCDEILGVDLSLAMIGQARATGLYARIEAGDLLAFLSLEPEAGADLVVAADVFVYLGRLDEVFQACVRALEPGGLLAFTVQDSGGPDMALGEDARFAHSEGYLRDVAEKSGLTVVLLEQASTRRDRGEPVPGLVAVMRQG